VTDVTRNSKFFAAGFSRFGSPPQPTAFDRRERATARADSHRRFRVCCRTSAKRIRSLQGTVPHVTGPEFNQKYLEDEVSKWSEILHTNKDED
jgi:hypothetical protein